MGIPLYPQKDKTIFINIVHDTSSCIRFVALESVGKAASAHEGARFLSGYLDIFDPTKKTYVKWLWKATGYPLRQGIYRWNAVVLDTPDDYVCNGAFTAEMLNGVASRIEGMEHTTLAEQIALFMVGLLVSFASRNKKVIENDMAAPIATQSKIIPGMHRHYKGGVYDVL
ncbi:MAG: hypothetical protein Q7R63_01610, partial [bacterium]|nr:hypothetical protein [bacterium]